MKFKYNGRIYNPINVEKKLKKLGITVNDIEIIPEKIEEDNSIDTSIKKYYYRNPITGYTITSIYDNLNVDGYERI